MSEERSKRTIETSGGKKITVEIKRFENEKASLFDLGHPLLNSIADSVVKAAGVGALQAVSREAYFTVVDGAGSDSSENNGSNKLRFPNLRGESSKSLEALVKNTGKESLQWGIQPWAPTCQWGPQTVPETAKLRSFFGYFCDRFYLFGGATIVTFLRIFTLETAMLMLLRVGMLIDMAGLAAGLYSGITYGMKEARGGTHDWRNSVVAGALTGAAMAVTTSERTSHDQVVQSALTGAAISAAANLLSSVF